MKPRLDTLRLFARNDGALLAGWRASFRFGAMFLSLLVGIACATNGARADEGGVSFWLPGIFGSLAAVPQQQPGWAFATFFYHTTVSAGGDVALAREFETRRVPVNFSGTLSASLHATANLQFVDPTYAFATPVFGGQFSLGLLAPYGRASADLSGTLTGTASVGGIQIPIARFDSFSDAVTGFGDLYPQAFLRWNSGVHNYMLYATGDIPVGAYDSARLSNIGIGHGAIDAGAGYTYFDPKTGHEFSAVTGFTYNFTNPATNYQNGVDWHLDWGASQFLSKQFSVGLVGYVYDQVSGDSGSGDKVGPFESRVIGVGPQVAFLFPVGDMQGYLNLKGYGEFDGHDRPSGWNAWVVFSIAPAAPAAATPSHPILTKVPPRG